MDRSDAIIVRERPARGEPRRTVYRPRSDGGWWVVEEYHNGCQWVRRGKEAIDSIGFEGPIPPELVDGLEIEI